MNRDLFEQRCIELMSPRDSERPDHVVLLKEYLDEAIMWADAAIKVLEEPPVAFSQRAYANAILASLDQILREHMAENQDNPDSEAANMTAATYALAKQYAAENDLENIDIDEWPSMIRGAYAVKGMVENGFDPRSV